MANLELDGMQGQLMGQPPMMGDGDMAGLWYLGRGGRREGAADGRDGLADGQEVVDVRLLLFGQDPVDVGREDVNFAWLPRHFEEELIFHTRKLITHTILIRVRGGRAW